MSQMHRLPADSSIKRPICPNFRQLHLSPGDYPGAKVPELRVCKLQGSCRPRYQMLGHECFLGRGHSLRSRIISCLDGRDNMGLPCLAQEVWTEATLPRALTIVIAVSGTILGTMTPDQFRPGTDIGFLSLNSSKIRTNHNRGPYESRSISSTVFIPTGPYFEFFPGYPTSVPRGDDQGRRPS
jgi:hypothetical protein